MKFALINPPWTFDRSIYFGCREPHLPLEYAYAGAALRAAGHEATIVDGQLHQLSLDDIRAQVAGIEPDAVVITTAPSYLFWRCAPPELRVPQAVLRAIADLPATRIVIGPHASTSRRRSCRAWPLPGTAGRRSSRLRTRSTARCASREGSIPRTCRNCRH